MGKMHPQGSRSRPLVLCFLVISAVLLLSITGCSFSKLKKDVEKFDSVGLISGKVRAPGGTGGVYVLLFEETEQGLAKVGTNTLTELMDSWAFAVNIGVHCHVIGFRDLDGNRLYSPGEPAAILGGVMAEQSQIFGVPLDLQANTVIPNRFTVDVRGGLLDDDAGVQFVAGDLIDFDAPRFSAKQAGDAVWAPLAAAQSTGLGIYFLDEYDPTKIPVLFVHGVGGSPAEFRVLAQSVDLKRFQPWFFYYPSGFRLHLVGRSLKNQINALQGKLGFETIYVVAHSMGGLVCRSAILQAERSPDTKGLVKLFVTIATPLEGHAAAKLGLKYTPVPVPAWIDMAPGSNFLTNIRQPLPGDIPYYILFTFRRGGNMTMIYSHDGVVSVMSQIPLWAQEEAVRFRGYDEDHESVLSAEEPLAELARILDEVTRSP